MQIIAFTKVRLPHGWLGNMAPYPVTHNGRLYRTTEALFQALRFDSNETREEIRAEKSPMSAKMRAKGYRDQMVVVPQSDVDVANMKAVLRLKLNHHRSLAAKLRESGDATIIEDCTRRQRGSGLFWGAALIDGEWQGENVLGRLWMELRDELESERAS